MYKPNFIDVNEIMICNINFNNYSIITIIFFVYQLWKYSMVFVKKRKSLNYYFSYNEMIELNFCNNSIIFLKK